MGDAMVPTEPTKTTETTGMALSADAPLTNSGESGAGVEGISDKTFNIYLKDQTTAEEEWH